jgi:hypothetical protein
MPRKIYRRNPRIFEKDSKNNTLYNIFLNNIMRHGKKALASDILSQIIYDLQRVLKTSNIMYILEIATLKNSYKYIENLEFKNKPKNNYILVKKSILDIINTARKKKTKVFKDALVSVLLNLYQS